MGWGSFDVKHILLAVILPDQYLTHLIDRPGHDFRYALNCEKIKKKLKWKSRTNLNEGLADTFQWYLNNIGFFTSVSKKLYDKRLGLN